MENSQGRRQAVLVVVLALAAAPYFIGLGASSLWDSNEAFYAETPREMIERGDYVNPTFNYQPRFNKPPLCYWVVALSYKAFGVTEWAERLPIALGAMVIIITAFSLARATFSLEAGLLAAIAMAATPRFLMFSRRIIIDVYIAMFMGLTLLFFTLAELRPARRRLYLTLMYASAGLGLLTKGPIAVALPALAFLLYLAIHRQLNRVREMMLPAGVVIIAAIALPWYVAIYTEHGWRYITTFILQDNISRYTQATWGPERGPFFYATVVVGDFFPWSIFLAAAAVLAIRRVVGHRSRESQPGIALKGAAADESEGERQRQARALLVIWIIVIIIFFSLSRSKEDLYVLPVYTAAAAIVGRRLACFVVRLAPHTTLRWAAVIAGGAILLMGAGTIYLFNEAAQIYRLAGVAALGWAALVGGGVAAAAALAKRRTVAVVIIAMTVAALHWIFVLRTLPDFERYKPVAPLSAVIAANAAPDALAGYFRLASPSMVFYLRRPIFEHFHEEELQAAFASGKEVYCLMTARDYEAIKHTLPATSVLASHPIFQVKLRSILNNGDLPQVVLITNKLGAGNSQ
jgi:4-amino-4-deoxy-L-arabinose transferase-like glycosyltransferase